MIKTFIEICSEYPVDYGKLEEMLDHGLNINNKVDEEDESRGIVIDSLEKQLVLRTDIFDKVIILLVDKSKYNERELFYIRGQYQLEFDDALFR